MQQNILINNYLLFILKKINVKNTEKYGNLKKNVNYCNFDNNCFTFLFMSTSIPTVFPYFSIKNNK